MSPPHIDKALIFSLVYITYATYFIYCCLFYLFYLFYLCCRWLNKRYVIICPPPVARKPPPTDKASKTATGKSIEVTVGDKDPEHVEDQKGVMYYEYDLMFHYLLASLRRADGANSVTSAGVKTFDIFAGLGEHR